MLQHRTTRIGIATASVVLMLSCSAVSGHELGDSKRSEEERVLRDYPRGVNQQGQADATSRAASRDVVWDWLQKALKDTDDLSHLEGNVVLYETQWHTGALSAAELGALKREVQGRPDHPGHRAIEVAERRRSAGPDVTLCKLWIGPKDRWRFAQTPIYNEHLLRVDWAGTSKHMWRLNDTALSVFVDNGDIPPGEDPRSLKRTATREVLHLLSGGLNRGARLSVQPSEVVQRGDRWLATAVSDSGVTREYLIRWDEALGRGFVESSKVVGTSDRLKHLQGMRHEFKDWRLVEGLDIWVAKRIDRFDQQGAHDFSIVYEGIEPVPAELFRRLVQIPPLDGDDADRGPVTATKVYDYRPSKMTVTRPGADGEVIVQGLPGSANRSRLRILGMVSLAGLILLFVVLRARRAGVGA